MLPAAVSARRTRRIAATAALHCRRAVCHHRRVPAAASGNRAGVRQRQSAIDALLLGQARGAAITAAVLKRLPVAEYTALQVKQAVVGHGKAAKQQVQDMVQRLLSLQGSPQADAADALACALCHANHAGMPWRQVAAASGQTWTLDRIARREILPAVAQSAQTLSAGDTTGIPQCHADRLPAGSGQRLA